MLAHFAALNRLGMWQAQRCPDAQGVPDSDPVVRQRRDGQQPRAASQTLQRAQNSRSLEDEDSS